VSGIAGIDPVINVWDGVPPEPAPDNDVGPKAPCFTTKDSGERVEFDSGMKRDVTAGKARPDLVLDGPMFVRWAALMTRGAEKYEPGNWLKAAGQAEYNRFLESCFRHFTCWYYWRRYGLNLEQWPNGPITREPLSEDHAAAIMFNVNGVEYVAEKLEAAAQ